MGVSKESISKFLIGNRFNVKLRILSPENCKQSLQVKSWKAEVTAEKKQTQDYNQIFVVPIHLSVSAMIKALQGHWLMLIHQGLLLMLLS